MTESKTPALPIRDSAGGHAGALDYSTVPPVLVCPTWCTEGDTSSLGGEHHVHRHSITVPAGGPATCESVGGKFDPVDVTVRIGQYVTFGGSVLQPVIEASGPYFDLPHLGQLTPAGALALVAALTQALSVVLVAGIDEERATKRHRSARDELATMVEERIAGMVGQLRAVATPAAEVAA